MNAAIEQNKLKMAALGSNVKRRAVVLGWQEFSERNGVKAFFDFCRESALRGKNDHGHSWDVNRVVAAVDTPEFRKFMMGYLGMC